MKAVVAIWCVFTGLDLSLATAPAPAPAKAPTTTAFKSLAYVVELSPDFRTGLVSGTERLKIESLSDGLDIVSFTANALAVR